MTPIGDTRAAGTGDGTQTQPAKQASAKKKVKKKAKKKQAVQSKVREDDMQSELSAQHAPAGPASHAGSDPAPVAAANIPATDQVDTCTMTPEDHTAWLKKRWADEEWYKAILASAKFYQSRDVVRTTLVGDYDPLVRAASSPPIATWMHKAFWVATQMKCVNG